jgi:catechol 2,3-dioxygenase-like lactoylglutathione lyase family enzyme
MCTITRPVGDRRLPGRRSCRPRTAPLALLPLLAAVSCTRTDVHFDVNPYRTYGIDASNAFFYYEDRPAAEAFYTEVLGLRPVADYGFATILQIAETSYLTLVDAAAGMHDTDEPKTVALALVTDQLDAWYAYLVDRAVPMLHDYDPVDGRPHHGFVIVDPEGYYLEFERFNPHAENRDLLPLLDSLATIPAHPAAADAAARGFKGTVLWLYYDDLAVAQRFYEDEIGLTLVVDQGWAKIYPTSTSGFLGLVDGARGMHAATERQAVTVSLLTDGLDGWLRYARNHQGIALRSDSIDASDPRYRAFVAYDPQGYFLEFDTFLEHPDNVDLTERLER